MFTLEHSLRGTNCMQTTARLSLFYFIKLCLNNVILTTSNVSAIETMKKILNCWRNYGELNIVVSYPPLFEKVNKNDFYLIYTPNNVTCVKIKI